MQIMDNYFSEMVELIKVNKSIGQIAIKAEFESEGTRMSELLRLKEIAHAAEIPLVVKIGGCEAIRDLLDCKDLRIANIVAPMVESRYAAFKFVQSLERVYTKKEFRPNSYINVETKQSFQNIQEISNEIKGKLTGVVMGRVDYVGSLGITRKNVNSEKVLNDALALSSICKESNLDFVLGGGISIDAIFFLRKVKEINLTRFETRKCVFDSNTLEHQKVKDALRNAVLFELLWLKSKQSYNSLITDEDNFRIQMLEQRHLYNTNSCSQL